MNFKRTLLPMAIAAALIAGCDSKGTSQPTAEAPSAQTQAGTESLAQETLRLNAWLDAQYEEQLQFSPIQLSFLGRKDLYDQIDDFSTEAHTRQMAWKKASVEKMKAEFDRSALTNEGKSSYDLWIFQYEQDLKAEPFLRHQYIFEQMGGAQSQLPNFLMNFHKVETAADMEAFTARIGGIARGIDQLLEHAKTSAKMNIRPPRFATEGAIDQASKLVTGAPFDDSGTDAPLWANAQAKVDALLEQGTIDEAQAGKLKADAKAALVKRFGPSYNSLIAWLKTDMAKAPAEPHGASSLPDGAAYYQMRLEQNTTTDMTADEVHALGLKEVARIRKEMEAIKNSMAFEGDLQAFFKFLREDPQFYYPNTDEGRQAYIDDSTAFLDAIEAKLPEYFGILPKAKLVVKRVEAFREQAGGAQHYYPGTPDGSRPGIYYAHLADMNAYSTADMETVAYHEGNPGHHMQISIAQERTDIPQFRTQAGFTVYSEGWALYSEKLAKEMGAFEDPYKHFGHLTAEMWRAIRLVVDTGLHAKGWKEEQAVDYFLENSAIPETAVRSEVRRYIAWPGQATAYKIGMLKIQELRAKAEAALGDKFDIRGFHDTVLGGGALPLPILERRVNEWIASQA
ncbi:DUF885 domain-containing protein [Simiduia sp. 21SJ11W-1]|uniref:DUF885 domain-containing protein n=1 Tax=Simiduia sp. 21SJ11W-1 TaxID=2909669 RepID=UPI00209D4020|nr:DUF885 domain-containing protein [Simiduia sp. 21SJ11W-1]UTA47655.1 DUF885 domain-containing protein [Simiduia sp. 21SJ11W-1]